MLHLKQHSRIILKSTQFRWMRRQHDLCRSAVNPMDFIGEFCSDELVQNSPIKEMCIIDYVQDKNTVKPNTPGKPPLDKYIQACIEPFKFFFSNYKNSNRHTGPC